MRLLFLHGWGLDATLWDGVRAALPEHETVAWDRGYFGAPSTTPIEEPVLAVGHSLGAMLLAGMRGMVGLVAVNGFDRFVGEGAVAPRVVERMRRRFTEAPGEVLADFRQRIAAPPALKHIEAKPLAADLALLATSIKPPPPLRSPRAQSTGQPSEVEAVRGCSCPSTSLGTNGTGDGGGTECRSILVLHGGADPLLPEPMRQSVFAGAPRETLAGAGHLLPLTHPEWVAEHIRAFAA